MLDQISLPPRSLHHHSAYLATLGAMGLPCGLASGPDGTTAPWVMRQVGPARLLWMPLGPIWSEGPSIAAYHGLRDHLPRHHICLTGSVNAAEAQILTKTGAIPVMTPAHHAIVNLLPPLTTRRAALHGKWRNRLKSAERAGLTVDCAPLDPVLQQALLTNELSQRATRRYRAHPPAFTNAWATTHPDLTNIFIAKENNVPIAFVLILMHPPGATYHIGWASTRAKHLNAHNLLIWQAMTWLADRGYSELNLGTVDTDTNPGLARFKLGTGATIRPLGPTLLHLPRFRGRKRAVTFCH